MHNQAPPEASRVLLVDDDALVLRAHSRVLRQAGYAIETAHDADSALALLAGSGFDAIFTDIDMPGTNGLELLERIRAHDLDVPVVMITGDPSVKSAVSALEHGALRYLIKPIESEPLLKTASDAVRLHRIAKAKRQALDLAGGADRLLGDLAGLVASFGRTLESLQIAYQPIVSAGRKEVYAYEALLRSAEPTLPTPGAVIEAAERLDRVFDLGRTIRERAIAPLQRLPDGACLFLNLHPRDLFDPRLVEAPDLLSAAHRVVLEVTERASLHATPGIQARVAKLRAAGFRIALDDLGAGYAGLTSFSLLEPDIVKLDMDLVRGIHDAPKKQTLVRTMVSMCHELGIVITAEGIECAEERDTLARLGCDLMQGYFFARPGPPFVAPRY